MIWEFEKNKRWQLLPAVPVTFTLEISDEAWAAYSSSSGAATCPRRRRPFQRESKNERHINENKSITCFKTVSLVPSGGVSVLAVHGFRNIPVYLYNKLAHWRASLKEVLVLTREENIHQGRWKNRQLQLKEHLLNNSFPVTHSEFTCYQDRGWK